MPTTATAEPTDSVEVVEDPDAPSGRRLDVVRHEQEPVASTAIAAAANAAMANPGAPGAAEFMALAAQARIISLSGAAPQAIRDNPYIAFHVALIGRDFGLSVAAAAELVDIIDTGKGPRISLSPQLLNGQIRRLGLGSIVPVIQRPDLCVAAALGPNGDYHVRCRPLYPEHHEDCQCHGVLGVTEFTWEDAQTAELVGPKCQPGEHVKDQKRSKNGREWFVCGCNQGYITYPKRMMWWRGGGFCCDDYFPEASLGLYSPEALGAPVDDDGRPIDPSTVALPEGYEPAPDPKAAAAAERAAAMEEPADPLDILDLQIRAKALPDEQRRMLGEKWKEHERLSAYRVDTIPAPLVRLAAALVQGFEASARSATKNTDTPWIAAEARAVVVSALAALAPTVAADGPGDDPGPDGADTAPEAPTAPQGGQDGDATDPPDGDEVGAADGADGVDRPRQQHADDDDALADVLAATKAVVDSAPDTLVNGVVAEVKALHHSKIDAACRDHGVDPTGRHIDTRRMMVCAWTVEERMAGDESGVS